MSATVSTTRRRAARSGREEGGQTLVEFALLLPLLLLILFGTVEFGLVFVSYLEVVETAHDAARVASLGGSASQAESAGVAAAQAAGLRTSDVTVALSGTSASGGGWVPDTSVTASVQYAIPIAIPILWPFLGHALNLRSAVTMVEEGG